MDRTRKREKNVCFQLLITQIDMDYFRSQSEKDENREELVAKAAAYACVIVKIKNRHKLL